MTRHTPLLTIDLARLCANYRLLQARHVKGRIAAVVKADAYGLGMVPVAQALAAREGCDTFFVATLEEAVALRVALPEPVIYVFAGPYKGEEADYAAYQIRPVLNSVEQLEGWKSFRNRTAETDTPLPPAALHVDTGMCRLGLSMEDLPRLNAPALVKEAGLVLLMSHLACASEPEHPLNAEQLCLFTEARRTFPTLPASLANSSGHFLDKDFHFDLGRPGCALYGITPNPEAPNPMQHVATWTAPIIQLRTIEREQPIGYGATRTVTRGMRVATVASGYADGLHRTASNLLPAWIGDHRCPMLGRVSMDLTCYDVTHVPDAILDATPHVTLMGPQQPVDDLAEAYGTIGYEVLCHLGGRLRREYRG
jgi:alanine racemase